MKLREVINIVENGEFLSPQEMTQVEKRIKQIKAYFEIETLYITSHYVNIFKSLLGVFVCKHQMDEYISNNEYDHIQIVKE